MKFVTQKSDGGIKKPDSLVEPLIGIYLGSMPGQYSPIYAIRDAVGVIHKVRGCTDLDNKMRGIEGNETILIQFEKYVPTSKGNPMVIMLVQKAAQEEDDDDEFEQGHAIAPIQFPAVGEVLNEVRESSPDQNNVLARFGVRR